MSQSVIRKRCRVASKNRDSANETADNRHVAEPRRSVRASNANTSAMQFAENNVPRRERDHAAGAVLPPNGSFAPFLRRRNVYRAEEPDDDQTELAEMLPQSQAIRLCAGHPPDAS